MEESKNLNGKNLVQNGQSTNSTTMGTKNSAILKNDINQEIRQLMDSMLLDLELFHDSKHYNHENVEIRLLVDDLLCHLEKKLKYEKDVQRICNSLKSLNDKNFYDIFNEVIKFPIFEDRKLLEKIVDQFLENVFKKDDTYGSLCAQFSRMLYDYEKIKYQTGCFLQTFSYRFHENVIITEKIIHDMSEHRKIVFENVDKRIENTLIKIVNIHSSLSLNSPLEILVNERSRMFQLLQCIGQFYRLGLIRDLNIFYYLTKFKEQFWNAKLNIAFNPGEIFAEYMIVLIEIIGYWHNIKRHKYAIHHANEMDQELCSDGCYLKSFTAAFLYEYRRCMSKPVHDKIIELLYLARFSWRLNPKFSINIQRSIENTGAGASLSPKASVSESNNLEISETWMIYLLVTKPYIQKRKELKNDTWIYNLLEGKRRRPECILLKDNHPELGFILAKDVKWRNSDINNLYLLAIVRRRDLHSIRDLRGEHIPLLENIRTKTLHFIQIKYPSINPHKDIELFFHYLPSTYHLHLHVVNINSRLSTKRMSRLKRSFHLDDILANLKTTPDYYKKTTLRFTALGDHYLCEYMGLAKP